MSYIVISSFLHEVKKLLQELSERRYFYVNKEWRIKIKAMLEYIKMKQEGG